MITNIASAFKVDGENAIKTIDIYISQNMSFLMTGSDYVAHSFIQRRAIENGLIIPTLMNSQPAYSDKTMVVSKFEHNLRHLVTTSFVGFLGLVWLGCGMLYSTL